MKQKDYEELLVKNGYEEIDLLEGEDYEWARSFKESVCQCIIENDEKEYEKIDVYVKVKDIETCIEEDDDDAIVVGVGMFHIFAIEKEENQAVKVTYYDSFVKVLDTIEIRSRDELDQLNKIYDEFECDLSDLLDLEYKSEEWANA